MKIIRVRRGFTTNSSGANEYLEVPPDIPQEPAEPAEPDAAPAKVATDAAPAPAPVATDAAPARRDAARDGGVATVAARQPDTAPPSGTGTPTSGNVLMLVLVLVGVIVLFATERVIRSARRRLAMRRPAGPSGDPHG
jgi:hypothetical protein